MTEKHSVQLKNSLLKEIKELVNTLNFAWKWIHDPERTDVELTVGIERFGQLYDRAVYVVNSLRQKFAMQITSIYSRDEDYFVCNMIIQSVNTSAEKGVVTFTPIDESGKEGKEKVWKGDVSSAVKKKKGREKMYEGLPFELLPKKEQLRRLQPTIFKEKK